MADKSGSGEDWQLFGRLIAWATRKNRRAAAKQAPGNEPGKSGDAGPPPLPSESRSKRR